MPLVNVTVAYDPPHFNPTARCNVPGAYRFEAEGFEFGTGVDDIWIYADGFTFEEGLEDMKRQLKKWAGTGRIRLRGDIPSREYWRDDVTGGRGRS